MSLSNFNNAPDVFIFGPISIQSEVSLFGLLNTFSSLVYKVRRIKPGRKFFNLEIHKALTSDMIESQQVFLPLTPIYIHTPKLLWLACFAPEWKVLAKVSEHQL